MIKSKKRSSASVAPAARQPKHQPLPPNEAAGLAYDLGNRMLAVLRDAEAVEASLPGLFARNSLDKLNDSIIEVIGNLNNICETVRQHEILNGRPGPVLAVTAATA